MTPHEFLIQMRQVAAAGPQIKAAAERSMRETHQLQRRHPQGRATRRLTIDPRITMQAGKNAAINELTRIVE